MQFRGSKHSHFVLLSVLATIVMLGCAAPKAITSGGTSVTSEAAYCSTVTSYTSAVTLSGTASYYRRLFHATLGLGSVDPTAYPIRRAEVRVISDGNVIQCGTTDDNGAFSVQVPNSSTTATIQVNSRGDNNYVMASVLNNPTDNVFYTISTTVTPTSNQSGITLTASATGDVLGGAFNIFDQIVRTNDFLRTKTAGCNGVTCTAFTKGPKVYAYWKLGFNPGTYVGTSSGLSYYLPGKSQLFILGGLNGDPNNTDTDHFDNPVIIHEYGHFLEDTYSKTDSPGGSHNGNSVIDPRLAWGEGWANFLGVYVNAYFTGVTKYIDTYGNTDGTTRGYYFNYDLEANSPSRDVATVAGQGNFREFSIARTLYDGVDKDTDGASSSTDTNSANDESITDTFQEYWTILTQYFPSSSYHFRNYGLFMELRAALGGATNMSSLLTSENQKANRDDYAKPIANATGCTLTITGPPSSSGFSGSNQLSDNDFYQYTHSGGALTISLSATGTPDLDLFLYKEGYTYGSSSTWVGYSDSTGSTETISTSSLAAGTYMINVKVYSGSGTSTYTLSNSGGQLCP